VKVADTNYRTNILLVDVEGTGLSAPEFSRRLREVGIWINPKSATTLRIVLHRHIEDSDVKQVIDVFHKIAVHR
jgi:threonine aldolase